MRTVMSLSLDTGAVVGTAPFLQLLLEARAAIRRTREGLEIEVVPEAAEQSALYQARDTAAALSERDARRLRDIDAAIERISEGTYGECLECSAEISEKRLRAVPEAALCRSCAEQAEAAARAKRAGVVLGVGDEA